MVKGKFIEGQSYQFRYVKRILTDEEFFVFEDFTGERHLIPAYHYRNYKFEINNLINCLINRIDCSGKVYLEPEHPYYKIGNTYDFKFKELMFFIEENYNKYKGSLEKKKIYKLIVLDKYGNEHQVNPHKWQKIKKYRANNISCKLIKIVNGQFELMNMESNTNKKRFIFR